MTTDNDVNEKKKWLIQRIDMAFQVHIDWLNQDKENFQKVKQKEIERWEQFGKSVLGSMAFIVSLIGILSAGNIFASLPLIFWVLLFGMLIYISALVFNDRNESVFNKIENNAEESNSLMYYAMGYFHRSSMKLDDYTEEDFDQFYLFFVYYTVPALDLGEYQYLKKAVKSIFISEPARKFLRQRLQSKKNRLDKAVEKYNEEKSKYEYNEFLQHSLMMFGNYLLEYKKGNEVKFEIKQN